MIQGQSVTESQAVCDEMCWIYRVFYCYGKFGQGSGRVAQRERIAAAHDKHGQRRRPVIAEQKQRNKIGREINAEVAAIEREAIVRGWLAKGWKELL